MRQQQITVLRVCCVSDCKCSCEQARLWYLNSIMGYTEEAPPTHHLIGYWYSSTWLGSISCKGFQSWHKTCVYMLIK